MSAEAPPPGPAPSSPTTAISPEELAGLLAASGMVPAAGAAPGDPPGKNSLRRKLIIASLIAAVGIGASIMSCVGQSFSYRQAHALEGIEQQLKEIRASCVAGERAP